jgi:hypothetical protein
VGRDFPHLPRPALGPTQPPTQWAPGLSRGVKWWGRGGYHPHSTSAEADGLVELDLHTPGSLWPVIGRTLPLLSSNTKFHENLSSVSRVVSCRRTDGLTDMTMLIVVFRNVAKAPKIIKC